MRISFFETNNGMDVRAAQGGVYMVEIEGSKGNENICLYIGESGLIASRCGSHLFSLYNKPEYFGLGKDDLENEEFTLVFSIIEVIDEKKNILSNKRYKQRELAAIKNYKPLTQSDTSDRQIQNKTSRVQDEMRRRGFK